MKKMSANGEAGLPLIGQKAPSFEAPSSSGSLLFPENFAGSWGVLFSHTRAFTPASSSDIARIREIGDEFRNNGCALVDLYAGDFDRYIAGFRSLRDQSPPGGPEGGEFHFMLVDDGKRAVARNYGICCEEASFHEEVSSFFVIDPSSVIRAILMYHPDNVSRAFEDLLRILIALRKQDELHCRNYRCSDSAGTPVYRMHVQNRVALAF